MDEKQNIWDGNAYRVVTSIPKNKAEALGNIEKTLKTESIKDVFYFLNQIHTCSLSQAYSL